MNTCWKNNQWWIGLYAFLLLVCLVVVFTVSKYNSELFFNRLNNNFFDVFFKVFTQVGTLPTIALIIVSTLFFKFRIAFSAVASSLFAVFLTQLSKHVIWPDSPRPKILLSGLDSFHVVDGVHLHSTHSFPSGHTSGAFALFIVLALYCKSPYLKFFFLLVAILVAYSRLYLSQHFLVDVTAGSFIGFVSAMLAYWWLNSSARKENNSLDRHFRFSRPWIG